MSVDQLFPELFIKTPTKQYVDHQITGWMQTNHRENTLLIQHPKIIKTSSFRSHHLKLKRNNFSRQEQIPTLSVPQQDKNAQQCHTSVKKQNIFRIINECKLASAKSKQLGMKKVNCKLNIYSKDNFNSFVVGNNWHNRPLIKCKFKLKEQIFKMHLRHKTVQPSRKHLDYGHNHMINQMIHQNYFRGSKML